MKHLIEEGRAMRRTVAIAGRATGCLVSAALVVPAALGVDVPDYDFEWCVIGDPGNAPYSGPYENHHLDLIGRGSVPSIFRIARTEVTSAQWVGFIDDPTSGIFAADDCELDVTITADSSAEIVIDGDVVGTIDINGDLIGDLVVHGSVSDGGITVTGNLDAGSSLTIDGDVSNATIRFTGMLAADARITIGDELKNGSSIIIDGGMVADSSIAIGTGATVTAVDATSWIEIGDEVEEDAEILLDGDLAGAVYLRDLVGLLSVEEDVTASGLIVMDELVDTGTLAEILVKGFLEGQIIINQNDDGSEWLGKISAATYGIGPGEGGDEEAPYYQLTSADLGGGAIGLVPFFLHGADCDPLPGSDVSGTPGSVTIAHYGPVIDDSTSGMPVSVWKKPIVQPFPPIEYVEVTSEFQAEILTNDRLVGVSPVSALVDGFECGYFYKIMPTEALHCGGTADLAAGEVDVADYEYVLKVLCRADLSMNGAVDPPDPVLWMAGPVDVNDDGVTDPIDLTEIFEQME